MDQIQSQSYVLHISKMNARRGVSTSFRRYLEGILEDGANYKPDACGHLHNSVLKSLVLKEFDGRFYHHPNLQSNRRNDQQEAESLKSILEKVRTSNLDHFARYQGYNPGNFGNLSGIRLTVVQNGSRRLRKLPLRTI
jgi:hypothetical protein